MDDIDHGQQLHKHFIWLVVVMKKIVSITFSQLGFCGLVGLYAVAGAFLFRKIEGPYEKTRLGHMKRDLEAMVQNIVDYTERQGHLEEDEWKAYAELQLKDYERLVVMAYNQEGYEGNDDVHNVQWTFSGSLLYAISVFTTIGYGNLTPKTQLGKVVTIAYATVGIPLMLLCLANIAESMANAFAWVYYNIFCFYGKWTKRKRRLERAALTPRPYTGRRVPSRRRSRRHRNMKISRMHKDSSFETRSLPGGRIGRHETMSSIDSFVSNAAKRDEGHGHRRASTVYAHHAKPNVRKLSTPVSKKSFARTFAGTTSEERLSAVAAASKPRDQKISAQTLDKLLTGEPGARKKSSPSRSRESEPLKRVDRRSTQLSNETSSGRETDEYASEPEALYKPEEQLAETADERQQLLPHSESGFVDDEIFEPAAGEATESKYLQTVPELHPLISVRPIISDNMSLRSLRRTVSSARQPHRKLPVSLGVILVVGFIGSGALLFALWEEWNIFDAAYFCFITMTTIGFGDFVPGKSMGSGGPASKQDKVIACVVYLMFGVALIAMCFRLMQDDVVQKTKWLGRQIGLLVREPSEYSDSESEIMLDIVNEALAELHQQSLEQNEDNELAAEAQGAAESTLITELNDHLPDCQLLLGQNFEDS